jgi:hypothetical protein
MNVKENLKAYLDRELSDHDHATVAQALNSSSELRDELDEIARLSEGFQGTWQVPKPTGFESTMERIGRRDRPWWTQARWVPVGAIACLAVALSLVTPNLPLTPGASAPEVAATKEFSRGAAMTESYGAPAGDESVAARAMAAAPGSGEAMAAPSGIAPLIVKSAALGLQVFQVSEAQKAAENHTRANQGLIESSFSNRLPDDRMSITMGIRVPVERFEPLLQRLRELGKVTSESMSGQDVTTHVADIDARLRVMRAEESQLVALLGRANRINEILQIREQLRLIRSEIESLDAQQKSLRGAAKMSTITLTLESTPRVSQEDPNKGWLENAWARALTRLASVAQFLAAAAINLLVLSPVWLPLLALAIWWARRR